MTWGYHLAKKVRKNGGDGKDMLRTSPLRQVHPLLGRMQRVAANRSCVVSSLLPPRGTIMATLLYFPYINIVLRLRPIMMTSQLWIV